MFKRLKSKEAIEVYKNYLVTHPDSSRVAFILGQALKENGEYQSAFNYLQKSLNLLPADQTVSEFSRNFIETRLPRLIKEIEPHIGGDPRR